MELLLDVLAWVFLLVMYIFVVMPFIASTQDGGYRKMTYVEAVEKGILINGCLILLALVVFGVSEALMRVG